MVEIEHSEPLPPLKEVNRFLTKMWLHPLLDKKTVEHRESGIQHAHFLLDLFRATNPSFGLMVGSSVWTVTDRSDYDFILFTTKPEDHAMSSVFDTLIGGHDVNVEGHTRIPEPHRPLGKNDAYLPAVFFTPDEFAFGNKDLLHKYRLQAVKRIQRDFNIEEYWNKEDSYINQWFWRYRKGWGLYAKLQPSLLAEKNGRLMERIDERSSQSRVPDVWTDKFLEALGNFTVPKFETFRDAITASNGRLNLAPQFAAQGIQ